MLNPLSRLASLLGGALIPGAGSSDPSYSLIHEPSLALVRSTAPEATRFVGAPVEQDRQILYRRTTTGVGVMTIDGGMAPRGIVADDRYRWVTYEGLNARIDAIGRDTAVHSVIVDWNSPGGYVAGSFETADKFHALSQIKRVVSIASPLAASAGYLVASASSELVVSPSGEVGSIGVLMMHFDYSGLLSMLGIKPTIIKAGAHKTDGNPVEPLTGPVKADLEAEVEALRQRFAKAVGTYRPKLGAAGALATEARMYDAEAAVAAGLADRVATFDQVLAELSASPARNRAQPNGGLMTQPNGQPAADAAGTFTQAQLDAAVAAATSTATGAAAQAAGERISKILGSDKVKGKEKIALDLAAKAPQMSADDVIAFVDGVPSASKVPSIQDRQGGSAATLALGNAGREPQGNAPKIDTTAIYAKRAATCAAAGKAN